MAAPPTAKSRTKGRSGTSSARRRGAQRKPRRPSADESTIVAVARQLRSWTDSALGIAGAAADASFSVAKSMLPKPGQREALERAGAWLRQLRETAGLSIEEVGKATNLDDPELLELVESGKIALPFEIILRLAGVLGRNDPISFVMRLTRSSNPEVWRTLENLGVGRLVVQAGREREFANIYRAHDAARQLSDEEFARLLAFTRAAVEMALAFRKDAAGRPRRRSRATSGGTG